MDEQEYANLCPACDGYGSHLTVYARDWGTGEPTDYDEVDCVACGGTGLLTVVETYEREVA